MNKFRVRLEPRNGHKCTPSSEVWAPVSHLKENANCFKNPDQVPALHAAKLCPLPTSGRFV